MLKLINPFTNIKVENVDNIKNDSGFHDMRALNIGVGSKVFRADERGIWLGAEDFADAPFSVDMGGKIVATTLELSAISGSLDDIADGDNYGRVAKTSISAGKIVLDGGGGVAGSLPIDNTDAKCTDPNADKTADHPQSVSWLTDAGAMAYEDMVEKAKLGTTIIDGGHIITDLLTADNIKTGTLIVDSSNIGIKVNEGGDIEFNCTSYSSFSEIIFNKTGYSDKGWEIYFVAAGGGGYQSGDLQILPMSSNDSNTVRLGMASVPCKLVVHGNISGDNIYGHNILPSSAFNYDIGSSSLPFEHIHTQVVYFKNSSYEKYMQINSSGGLEVNADFYVGGELSKASGSFKIDHPLKPKTHWLKHSFVECPDMLNLYVGKAKIVNGECKVKMPNWFIPLNGKNKKDYTYQLTSLKQKNNLWVKQEMNEQGEVIFAGSKDGEFSYIITGIRHDKYANEHRIKVESRKK